MATQREVLAFLRPDGGYISVGTDYEGITFEPHCQPFTKTEYEAGFEAFDAWVIEQNNMAEAKRQAALAKLEAFGFDKDDLKALGL